MLQPCIANVYKKRFFFVNVCFTTLLDATGTAAVPNACTQIGPFNSLWLRLSDPIDPSAASAIEHQAAVFTTGALYVTFDEWSSQPLVLTALRSSGFKFHAHHTTTKEQVYYKWCRAGDDKVPRPATSIEGACYVCPSFEFL